MKQSKILNPLRRNDLRAFEKKEVVLCICEHWRCNGERLRSQNSSIAASLPKGRFMSYTTFTPFGQVDVFAAEVLR